MSADTASTQSPASGLFNRVAGYSLVGKAQAVYNYAKQASPQLIRTGVFDLAENVVTTTCTSVAQQPLFAYAVEATKLEERGTHLLDKFDAAVTRVNDLNRQRQELQANVAGVVSTVSRAVYQPLDVALEVVDKYLPETQSTEVVLLSKVVSGTEHTDAEGASGSNKKPAQDIATPTTSSEKISKLTSKLQKVAQTKLTALKLRSAEQLASMHFAIDLIEYAKQNALVDYAKERIDPKTVNQVTETIQYTVETATQVVLTTVDKTVETAKKSIETAKEVATQTNIVVQSAKKVATEKLSAVAIHIQETKWKKQFDEIMGPYLQSLQTQSQRIAVVSISALAVSVDFALQQFQLTKKREFGQVLSNVAAVTVKAVEQSKHLTAEALVELEKALDSVQKTLRQIVNQASTLTVTSSFQHILELQARLASALKIVLANTPIALLTSPSSTA